MATNSPRDQRSLSEGEVDTPGERGPAILTWANAITCLRLLLVAPFLYFYASNRFQIALAVFVLAGLTDLADGYVARKLDQRSRLGRLFDPIADKILTTSAFLALAIPHVGFLSLPIWLVVMVILRDVLILIGAWILYVLTKYTGFTPTLAGKANTLLELALITSFLAAQTRSDVRSLLPALYVVIAISLVVSGVSYIADGARILKQTRRPR